MEEPNPKPVRSNEPSSKSTPLKLDGYIQSVSTEPEGSSISLRQAQTPKHCNKTGGVSGDGAQLLTGSPSRSRRIRSPNAFHSRGSPSLNHPKPPSSPSVGYSSNPDYYNRGSGGNNYYDHPASSSQGGYSNESYSNYYPNEPPRRGNDSNVYPYPPQHGYANNSYSNQNAQYGPPSRNSSYDTRDARYYNNPPHHGHEADPYGHPQVRHGNPHPSSYSQGGYSGYNNYEAPVRTYSSGGVPPSSSWSAPPQHSNTYPSAVDSRSSSYDHGPPRRTQPSESYARSHPYEAHHNRSVRSTESFSRTVSNSFDQKYPQISPGKKDQQPSTSPPVIPSAPSDTSWHQLKNVASVEEPTGDDKKPKKKVRVNPDVIGERKADEKERSDGRQSLVNTSSLDSLSDVASIADPIDDQTAKLREVKMHVDGKNPEHLESNRKRPLRDEMEVKEPPKGMPRVVDDKDVPRAYSNDDGSLNSAPQYQARYAPNEEIHRTMSHQSNTSQTTIPNMGNLASWDFENKDSFVERAASQGLLPSFSFNSGYNIPESYSMGGAPPPAVEVTHPGDRRPPPQLYAGDPESRNQSFDGYAGEGHHGEYSRGPPPMHRSRGYSGSEGNVDSRGFHHNQPPPPPSYHHPHHRSESPWGGVPGAPPPGPPPHSTYHPHYNPSYTSSHDSYHSHPPPRSGPAHISGGYQHGPNYHGPPPSSHHHGPYAHHPHGRGPSPSRLAGRYDDPQRRTSPPMPHHEDFLPPRNDYGMHHGNNPPPTVYIVPSSARGPIGRSNSYDPSMIPVNNQHMNHMTNSFGWSPDDDAALSEIMKKYKNPSDWERIAKEHGRGKSAKKCHERWIRYLKPGVRKGQWQDHEDAIVIEAVTTSEENPFTRWSELAQRLPGRVGKQIRDRWVNHLNPNINHMPFTREDDLLLFKGHQELGKRWVEISTKFFNNTRSENHIKNRWYSASFKKFILGEFGSDIDVFRTSDEIGKVGNSEAKDNSYNSMKTQGSNDAEKAVEPGSSYKENEDVQQLENSRPVAV